MDNLLNTIDFGNEAADDISPDKLATFFVEQQLFTPFRDPQHAVLLATAKKGVGKSALLKWVEASVPSMVDDTALVISIKGSDLVRSVFKLTNELTSPNDFIRDWMVRLCSLINRRIGAELSFAFNDDSITMVEASEIDGFRSKNILTALTERLRKLIPIIETSRPLPGNDVELLKRYEGRSVWILIDDLDATYQRTQRENLELSTFFSACRYLVSLISGLHVRITMRTDVWAMIRRYDESLDKFEQYVREITWNPVDFRSLLYKRIRQQMDYLGYHAPTAPAYTTAEENEEYLINQVFDKRMQWGDYEQRVYRVIYTLAYGRPRWAIQLCKLAQENAVNGGRNRISRTDIDAVWGEYGQKRIADLISEHRHQCSEIEELIVAFRGGIRHMTRDELLDRITRHITNHMTPIIEGRPAKDSLDIAHFLFRLGFIHARSNHTDSEGCEHYFFEDMPDFLSTRTDTDFGVQWEIHPCYREALDITKLNAASRNRRRSRR